MFPLILAALNTVLGFVFRSIIIKFFVFFSLYFIVHGFVAVMAELLPKNTQLAALFSSLPDTAWYFIDLFSLKIGINLVLATFVTRFVIRRIPVIG